MVAKDNIKAMALKIGNQLTRNAFKVPRTIGCSIYYILLLPYMIILFVPLQHRAIDRRVFEWGLTVNQNQKDYIRKQLRKYTRSIYENARTFYNSPRNFGAGLVARGCTYKKKIAYTRLSLSLSLSLSPPLGERARGEVGGSWTLVGSNHPTAIFSQRVLYPAGVQIVISCQRTV